MNRIFIFFLLWGMLSPGPASGSQHYCAQWILDHLEREHQSFTGETAELLVYEGLQNEISRMAYRTALVSLGYRPLSHYPLLVTPSARTFWEPYNPREATQYSRSGLGNISEENRVLRQLFFEAVQGHMDRQVSFDHNEEERRMLRLGMRTNEVLVTAALPPSMQAKVAHDMDIDPQFDRVPRLVWANTTHPLHNDLLFQASSVHYSPLTEPLARRSWNIFVDSPRIHYFAGPCHLGSEGDHQMQALSGLRPVVETSIAQFGVERDRLRIIVHMSHVYLWHNFTDPSRIVFLNEAIQGMNEPERNNFLGVIARHIASAALPDETEEEIRSPAGWLPRGNLDARTVRVSNREPQAVGPLFIYNVGASKRAKRWQTMDYTHNRRLEVGFVAN